jgi:flagellar protein FlbD
MIELTRLNGQKLFVNCDLLKWAEASPDTVLTLLTGEKMVVLESCAEVVSRAIAFRASVLNLAWPNAEAAWNALYSQSALNRTQTERPRVIGELDRS